MPVHLHNALRKALDVPVVPVQRTGIAEAESRREAQARYGGETAVGRAGERPAGGLVIRPAPGEPKAGDMPDLYLAVQNVSNAPIRLSDTNVTPKSTSVCYLS